MNIEKLARHLKEFTLDEIDIIAECDCKIELEQLLNEDKIVFEQGLYKYQEEKPKQETNNKSNMTSSLSQPMLQSNIKNEQEPEEENEDIDEEEEVYEYYSEN